MFGYIANIVIGLLSSVYGITTSVVTGVINTVVTGKFIVRQTGGIAGTNELSLSYGSSVATLANAAGGSITLSAAGVVGATEFDPGNGDTNLIALGLTLHNTAALKFRPSSFGAVDTSIYRLGVGVLGIGTGAASGSGWLQNTSGEARRTATQTVTDSTTFAADNTLSNTLIAGRRYRFYIWYAFTTVNSSGVKLDLNGGAATMTAINGTITVFSSAMAVLAAAQITALTSTTGVTASGTLAFAGIEGSLECLGAGTFIPRFAQNAETGAAESVVAQIGSYMTLADVP